MPACPAVRMTAQVSGASRMLIQPHPLTQTKKQNKALSLTTPSPEKATLLDSYTTGVLGFVVVVVVGFFVFFLPFVNFLYMKIAVFFSCLTSFTQHCL